MPSEALCARVRAMGGRETVASACCILGACLHKRNSLVPEIRVVRVVCGHATVGSVAFAYQPDILETLAGHGLMPASATHPSFVRQALSNLYRYEIRRLRRDLLDGRVAKADYIGHVVALRRKYWLLSLPTELWVVREE